MWVVYPTCVCVCVCLKIRLCLKMWFFISFVVTWYPEAATHAKNLLSHSIAPRWSSVNITGEVLELNWQSVQSWMGWNMPLCKWHTFWMVPCLICYFFVILFHIERKWLWFLMRNIATILLLKSKLSGKFQLFNTTDRSIEMQRNSWIF